MSKSRLEAVAEFFTVAHPEVRINRFSHCYANMWVASSKEMQQEQQLSNKKREAEVEASESFEEFRFPFNRVTSKDITNF